MQPALPPIPMLPPLLDVLGAPPLPPPPLPPVAVPVVGPPIGTSMPSSHDEAASAVGAAAKMKSQTLPRIATSRGPRRAAHGEYT
jgi:hypothetical protein